MHRLNSLLKDLLLLRRSFPSLLGCWLLGLLGLLGLLRASLARIERQLTGVTSSHCPLFSVKMLAPIAPLHKMLFLWVFPSISMSSPKTSDSRTSPQSCGTSLGPENHRCTHSSLFGLQQPSLETQKWKRFKTTSNATGKIYSWSKRSWSLARWRKQVAADAPEFKSYFGPQSSKHLLHFLGLLIHRTIPETERNGRKPSRRKPHEAVGFWILWDESTK